MVKFAINTIDLGIDGKYPNLEWAFAINTCQCLMHLLYVHVVIATLPVAY